MPCKKPKTKIYFLEKSGSANASIAKIYVMLCALLKNDNKKENTNGVSKKRKLLFFCIKLKYLYNNNIIIQKRRKGKFQVSRQGKNMYKTIIRTIAVYLCWLIVYFASTHLYTHFCTNLSVYGFLTAPFMTQTPHCRAFLWSISNGVTIIDTMWVLIGSFIISLIPI